MNLTRGIRGLVEGMGKGGGIRRIFGAEGKNGKGREGT
jgi:hypothetical protein